MDKLLKRRLGGISSTKAVLIVLYSILVLLLGCHSGVSSSGVVPDPQTTSEDSIKLVIDTTQTVPEVIEVRDTVTTLPEVKDTVPVAKPIPVPQPPVTAPALASVYISQLGIRESTGHNDGKDVEKYLRSVGLGKGYAWCAAYVRWCFDQAKIPTKINGAAASAHRPDYLVYFKRKELTDPKPGDVFTLWYTKLNRIGHTGFYNSTVNKIVFESYEGNTNEAGSREGDGVYKKYRSFNATYSISRWQQ